MFHLPHPDAFKLSPLFQELWEMKEGRRPYPDTAAKRHHFISQFVLRRFGDADRRIFQLNVKTGQPRKVRIDAAASRRNFYTFQNDEGERTKLMEAFLGRIESHAAPVLRKLIDTGTLSDPERATMSFFLAVLALRTPGARRMAQSMAQDAANFHIASHYSDPETFMRMYSEYRKGEEFSKQEAEELRQRTLEMLRTGELELSDGDGGPTMALLLQVSADFTQSIFGEMTWRIARSAGAQFVTSDRGIAMYDPTPEFPWSSEGLMSSDEAQTSIPLDPRTCLVLMPGPPTIESYQVDDEDVRHLNLRTYGWADSYVYGASQEAVTAVRRQARQARHLVVRPRPFRQVVLVEAVRGDTRLADQHRSKGWPPHLVVPDDDGKPRKMDYMVMGEDGDPVEVGVVTTELAKRRALEDAGRWTPGPDELRASN